MSNAHLFLKSGFPRAPLQNGLGRYINQLKRVTLKYCKSHGTSRGMREFLEFDLVGFAEKNPGTVVYVKPRRHKSPHIVAEYLNGESQFVFCKDYSREEVNKWLTLLLTQNGNTTNFRLRKFWHTDTPSIQGVWTPFTNREPVMNVAQFPDPKLSEPYKLEKTATDILLEDYHKFKVQSKNDGGE